MIVIAEMIEKVLSNINNAKVIAEVKEEVNNRMKEYPIFNF